MKVGDRFGGVWRWCRVVWVMVPVLWWENAPIRGPESLAEETRRDGRAWRMGSSLRKYLGESGELCTYLSNRGMLPFDIPIF